MVDVLTIIIVILAVAVGWFVFKKLFKLAIIIGIVILAAIFLNANLDVFTASQQDTVDFINLPEGFYATIFAENLGGSSLVFPGPAKGVRFMSIKDNKIYAAVPSAGTIYILEDTDKDNVADNEEVFISDLNRPHSVDSYLDWVYIAEEDGVFRVKDNNGKADLSSKEKITDLPDDGGHWTRTVKIIDNQVLISVGSSCNACNEEDERRSSIISCTLDGSECSTFASGLRNTVGFIEHQNKIYGVENGRDLLGNDLPPDEINIIEKGKNYGWPICYGQQIHDTDFDENVYIRNPCLDTEASFVDLPAHVAPLGLDVYTSNKFPEEYQGNLFIGLHGSWNSDDLVGYKVVNVDLETKQVNDFATGFLTDGEVIGRPVDVVSYNNGLLVSDDLAGKIYFIGHE